MSPDTRILIQPPQAEDGCRPIGFVSQKRISASNEAEKEETER
jgi:hypothetical protein